MPAMTPPADAGAILLPLARGAIAARLGPTGPTGPAAPDAARRTPPLRPRRTPPGWTRPGRVS